MRTTHSLPYWGSLSGCLTLFSWRTSWTETPLDRDPQDKDPTGQRPSRQRPPRQRPPWTETPKAETPWTDNKDPLDRVCKKRLESVSVSVSVSISGWLQKVFRNHTLLENCYGRPSVTIDPLTNWPSGQWVNGYRRSSVTIF